jgi:hypothetical protein
MSAAASWWHCGTNPGSRSKGQSAVASIAYRFAETFHDERYDMTRDYTRKRGVQDKFIVAPEDAPQWAYDPERLWNEAERAETRKNSTIFRDTVVALPSYLSPEERRAIARDLAQEISDRYGVAVSVAVHAPGKEGDQRNFHAHLMFTTRELSAEGFGKKTRVLDDKATGPKEVIWIQEKAQDIINHYLETAGSPERVDRRSFQERGIEREPTAHLGPTVTELERNGVKTERGNVNREIEQRNAERDGQKSELASVDSAIDRREQELDQPALSPEDAQQRLRGDKQFFSISERGAAVLEEKDLSVDRSRWRDRMLLYVARTAKSFFDGIAEKARKMVRSRKADRRERQEPTAQERRWQNREQARREQAERDKGLDL